MRLETLYWLEQGEKDLESAKKIFDIGIYYVSAFYCHQSVEKFLKAAILEVKRKKPPQDHNLRRLLHELDPSPPENVERAVIRINPFYFVSRYPDAAGGLPSEVVDKELATELINYADTVRGWVKSLMNQ